MIGLKWTQLFLNLAGKIAADSTYWKHFVEWKCLNFEGAFYWILIFEDYLDSPKYSQYSPYI